MELKGKRLLVSNCGVSTATVKALADARGSDRLPTSTASQVLAFEPPKAGGAASPI